MNYDEYFDKEYEYLPWNALSEKEKAEQEAWQAELSKRYPMRIGEGSVVSREAHIYEVRRARFGKRTLIGSHALLRGIDIETGDNCSFNTYCVAQGKIKMGDDVRIAPGAKIFAENHGYGDLDTPIRTQKSTSLGITIEDDCWIGANAVITDGVVIGAHSVVGAGAVVTKNVPPYSVVGGSPARVLRSRLAERKNDAGFKKLVSDFADFAHENYRNFISSHFRDNHYENSASDKERRRAVCDAVEIAAMFGGIAKDLSKEALIREIKSFQKDEGEYESVLSASYALEILGDKPIFFGFAENADCEGYLSAQSWEKDAWNAGHYADILGTALWFNEKYYAKKAPIALSNWLDKKISPLDGLWGGADLHNKVNGYYRVTRGCYAQFGFFVPYAEKTVDSVLAHAEKLGVPKNACDALDIIHPLFNLSFETRSRKSEGEAWCVKMLPEFILMAQNDGFPFETGGETSLKGTEMWLSIIYLMCAYLGMESLLCYEPKGVHRIR